MFLRRTPTLQPSDEELAARLRSGDRPPAGLLWDRYAHLLFGVAMKYLRDGEAAKDLVMELFEELPALLAKHDVRAFRPWVHAVARNRCLMALRKKDPSVALNTHHPAAPENQDAVLHEATLQALEAAISSLPEGQQRCIRAFYLERNSYQQVAGRTGFSVGQVRSHLQNGRRNLRNILQHHGPGQ